MMYKYGDLLYEINTYDSTGYSPSQVIRFDERRNKYLCFVFDMDGTDDIWHLEYISEDELDYLEKIEDINNYRKKDGSPLIPKNIDTRYFRIYDNIKGELFLLQKDVGKRKKGEVPTK